VGDHLSDPLVEQLIHHITRWRLVQPAMLFLEVTKPLSFVASQGLLLCEPLLNSVLPESCVADWADLLADRSRLEQVIARLEQEAPAHEGFLEEDD
jgi:hypothetical protein